MRVQDKKNREALENRKRLFFTKSNDRDKIVEPTMMKSSQ